MALRGGREWDELELRKDAEKACESRGWAEARATGEGS